MQPINRKPTLIFDYDGTIHNTMVIYESSFRKTYDWLVQEGYAAKRQIPFEQIAGWLGMNSRDMWNAFMPELAQEVKEEASLRTGTDMVEQVRGHKAVWYPQAEEVLDTLRESGYPMVILSNCKIAYREAHWKEFSMERWFDAFYDCESYSFAPKTEIIKEVQKAFSGPCIVIGDRKSDLLCARASGSPFIGCRYGYGGEGELEGADALIEAIQELPQQIEKLNRNTCRI